MDLTVTHPDEITSQNKAGVNLNTVETLNEF